MFGTALLHSRTRELGTVRGGGCSAGREIRERRNGKRGRLFTSLKRHWEITRGTKRRKIKGAIQDLAKKFQEEGGRTKVSLDQSDRESVRGTWGGNEKKLEGEKKFCCSGLRPSGKLLPWGSMLGGSSSKMGIREKLVKGAERGSCSPASSDKISGRNAVSSLLVIVAWLVWARERVSTKKKGGIKKTKGPG